MEVTNRTLSTLLRTLIPKNLQEWDLKLPHAKFTYNRTPVRATGYSPLEALYGINHLTPVALILLPTSYIVSFEAEKRVREMKKVHEKISALIEKVNEAYKVKANKNRKGVECQPGEPIWLHFRKQRSPIRKKSKLIAGGDGPFKVLSKVEANAYK